MTKQLKTQAKKADDHFPKDGSKSQQHQHQSIGLNDSILQFHHTIGSRAVQRMLKSGTIQAKLKINPSGDKYEQEADRIVEQVMRMPQPKVQRQELEENWEEEKIQLKPLVSQITPVQQQSNDASGHTPDVTPQVAANINLLKGNGQPLPRATRQFFEPRFGTDFGSVPIHTGDLAAESAKSINAGAFTLGKDIAFDSGQYSPETIEGKQLLAHELTHTFQQSRTGILPNILQRTDGGGVGGVAAPPQITARSIFPFPAGSRVVLNRILPDIWFDMLQSLQPQVGVALQAIESRVATVTIARDDLFEATLEEQKRKGEMANTLENVRLRLQRRTSGTFDLELTGQQAQQTTPTVLFARRNMTATVVRGAIILSTGTGAQAVPQLRVASGGSSKQVRIEAFTAPFRQQIPNAVRGLVPNRLEFIQITKLPTVPAGTTEEQGAVESVASRVRGQRRERRQRLTVGGGLQAGAELAPLLTASWQLNFRPIPAAGGFFQVPLEVQLQYAPASSILAQVSTGVETSLRQLNIPVNLRFNLGLAGGSIRAEETGSEPLTRGAGGITTGGGLGLEVGAFRFDIRYEHLFNLVKSSPNADSFFLRLGKAF